MKQLFLYLIALLLFLFTVTPGYALVVTYDMNWEFSGAYSPESSTQPWLRATFDDEGIAGSVNLKLEALNLVDAEHVKIWTFNLDRQSSS